MIEAETKVDSQASARGIQALLADDAVSLSLVPMPRIGQEPAREIHAYQWGDNHTTKGNFKLTLDGAAKIMAAYRSRNVVRCFDYFHATYDPSARPEDKKAAGQYRKELRGAPGDGNPTGGLWYVDCQWTPKAAQGIRDGEWPYISSAPVHDKDGVIVDDRNAALVTDPAMFGAASTLLSALNSPEGPADMADKKRLFMDLFSAAQMAMKRCQALADTDGPDKELANKAIGCMSPMMDMLSAHGGTSGYLADATLAAGQFDAGQALLSSLATECGEPDLAKLAGVVQARLDGKAAPTAPSQPKGVLLSDAESAKVVKLLLDGHATKVPAARRASLESLGLPAVTSYLGAAQDITPREPAPTEAKPLDPTSQNVENKVKDPAKDVGGKPANYTELTAEQRAKVDLHVDNELRFMGKQFNESTARESGMALLSDWSPPTSEVSTHMPPCGPVGSGSGGVS